MKRNEEKNNQIDQIKLFNENIKVNKDENN